MKSKDTTSENAILTAAEQVFINKGYAAARTTEIAKLAGVNHSMLHYYFGSKEELFNKVFSAKLQLFASSISFVLVDNRLPFIEKIKSVIETHFDFLAENPRLPLFLFNEMLLSPKKLVMLKELVFPKISTAVDFITIEIKAEAEKGNIKQVAFLDLLFNIVSQNITTVLIAEILYINQPEEKNAFLQKRKMAIINFSINSLKI
ncbi:MAG: TetR/AcrR family transcriptional regulator [Prevotellaceae bacterium]|jgi:AcrR family transcriptional regulator|nr:TetR/AcrR family transcriptional regulator [Prevotellaceae bacterium]